MLESIVSCVARGHDQRLLWLAALVCVAGVYGAFSLTAHTARSQGRDRRFWGAASIGAAGCTAWATHMIGLLAFRPGMQAGFEPVFTVCALLAGVLGIGVGVAIAMRRRGLLGRFWAGVVIGLGVVGLHYLGQAGYVVTGRVAWNWTLVALSVPSSLIASGLALAVAGVRPRAWRQIAAPLLLASIAILHFSGMAAAVLVFDPRVRLPRDALSPALVAPIVAGVSLGLVVLAVLGLRFTLRARALLRRDRQRVAELAAVALEGLAILDGETIVTANLSFGRLVGREPAALEGVALRTLLPDLDLANFADLEERDARLVTCDGVAVPVRVVRSEIGLGLKRQTVLAVRDQRERLRNEARLETLAHNDPLTGLFNRGRLHDLLSLQVASRRERDQTFGVLMVDLDRLKAVNDLRGQAAGDAVLRITAERLQSTLRDGDVLARLGGDEFVILQLDVEGEKAASGLAARIVDLLAQPMIVGGESLEVGASVGVALAPRDGDEPEALLHSADCALEAAKHDGGATYHFFDPALDARVQARRHLEVALRHAVAQEELELYFQPLVDAQSGRVCGAEALVRWDHPQRGMISPIEFIPLAEETGLIVPLGEWVLRSACEEAARWPHDLKVAVNLSPVQFRNRDLVGTVRRMLAETGLPARRLGLEITEGVLLADEKATLEVLTGLRALGLSIALDDFGTGYSSLSYLRRFRFDTIKVDQSFVRQVPFDAESVALVRAMLSMAACLGMSTTVEGVETLEQYAFSAAEGCTHIQGFLISRPLSADDFRRFVEVNADVTQREVA